ncbi:MAG: hypothetical protein M0Z30_01250 [Actinomycetota bacterium]|nr:hypothetical protein [Actinomycetota bacterium]
MALEEDSLEGREGFHPAVLEAYLRRRADQELGRRNSTSNPTGRLDPRRR